MSLGRRSPFRPVAFALAAVLVTAAPLAASSRRELVVRQEIVLDGQPIPAGSYDLKWKDSGDPGQVHVTVHRGTKVVVQASGKRVQLDRPSDNDSLVYATGEDGSSNLVEIRFAGSRTAIEVSQTAVARSSTK